MWDTIKDWLQSVVKSRLFPITVIYALLFFALVNRIFTLQIINGENISQESEKKKDKARYLKSTRGNIYDCNGKLLAYNELSYSVTIEDSGDLSTNAEKNAMIHSMIGIIEKNGDALSCDFNIILDEEGKFAFNIDGTALLNFKRDVYCVSSINKLKQAQIDATAEEVFNYLRYDKSTNSPQFNIGAEYSNEDALKIMNVRYALFLNRYKQYLATTIATNINEKTLVALKENSANLPGVEIITETYRKYNDSKYFSHVIGYTGSINEEELNTLKETKEDKKYTEDDQIGKLGIEKEYESYLHGEKGYEKLVTNQSGRIINVTERKEAISGNDVYLTIDAKLQKACYKLLEKKIANILLSNMTNSFSSGSKGTSSAKIKIPIYDVYFALIDNNVIDINVLNKTNATAIEKQVYNKFVNERKNVFRELDSLLAVNSKTSNKSASKEMREYLKYIYSFLGEQGILLKDEIDENDNTYLAYQDNKISLSEFLQYAIANNWIELSSLEIGDEYYSSKEIYERLITYTKDALKKDKKFAKKVYYNLIYSCTLSGKEICILLFEQGVLEYDESQVAKLDRGVTSPYTFLREKIKKLEITPAQLALEPCSGSIIITDVKTGEVKACVSYPGYDTNKYANKIDTDYYFKLYEDKSYPTIFRAVQQRTAPGSTYKMLTSIASLEEGIINLGDRIKDRVVFDKISSPPKCWSTSGHGSVDVSGAIEFSCNYFFYEMGYRFSQQGTNHELGLKKLEKYAKMFGFDAKSGISASEYEPQISNEDAIRSAIGQGNNNYTPSQISRYVTTVANKGTCYDLSVLDKVTDLEGKVILKNKAKVHNKVKIKSSTWDAVFDGMYRVVNGSKGHASSYKPFFKDLDVSVAGKTGTAQESKLKPNHALFVSFAPYEHPEISVTTVIPNGYASSNAVQLTSEVYKYYYSDSKKAKDKLLNGEVSTSNEASQISGD